MCLVIYDPEDGPVVLIGEDEMLAGVEALLDSGQVCVAHNLAFDASVIMRKWPHLAKRVWEAVKRPSAFGDQTCFTCTQVREKLLNLCTFGKLEFNLAGKKLKYGLADIMLLHFGIDRTQDKKLEDSYRLHFKEICEIPYEDWPQGAKDYLLDDAQDPYNLYQDQQHREHSVYQSRGYSCFEEEAFRCLVALSLQLMGSHGFPINAEKKAAIEKMLEEELSYDKVWMLLESGILRPEEAPRPHKNGAKNPDGTPKMTKGKPESRNMDKLRELILLLHDEMPQEVELRYTKPSKKFPNGQLSTDREWMDEHDHLDPILQQYNHRQKLQKLVSTELPRMCREDGTTAPIIYPCFDELKETGRSSSFAGKLHPSFNCQNVDPRVRPCFEPRPGRWMFSIDYSQMELGTWAQTCLELFGISKLADLINGGIGPHEYLGSALAYYLEPKFKAICESAGAHTQDDIFDQFMKLKKAEEWSEYQLAPDGKYRSFWKHFRTFAKPTGLGYPGGLGPKTFIGYAKSPYGVIVDFDTATQLREIWKETLPEAPMWLKHINKDCVDPYHVGSADDNGRIRDQFIYKSPFGLVRPNCSYCAAANGKGLQSPSANGALLAQTEVQAECEFGDLKGYAWPMGFIHDEIIGEVVADPDLAGGICEYIGEIMVKCMRKVTPDVKAAVECALMTEWDKRAEPNYDEQGRLIPWVAS